MPAPKKRGAEGKLPEAKKSKTAPKTKGPNRPLLTSSFDAQPTKPAATQKVTKPSAKSAKPAKTQASPKTSAKQKKPQPSKQPQPEEEEEDAEDSDDDVEVIMEGDDSEGEGEEVEGEDDEELSELDEADIDAGMEEVAGEVSDEDAEGAEGEGSEDDEEDVDDSAILAGIDSSAGEDSSDEEPAAEDEFKQNRPLVLLTDEDREALKEKLSKKDRKKARKAAAESGGPSRPGTVYLGRIPHGFYEKEMMAYFSQFGDVTNLRLSRNKKTGASKHYAFIQFASDEVAKIVAETMDNYLMFGHLLRCKFVAEEALHPDTFKGANKRFRVIPHNKIQREKHNKPKTEAQHASVVERLVKNESNKRKKLADLGIDYDFPGYEGKEVDGGKEQAEKDGGKTAKRRKTGKGGEKQAVVEAAPQAKAAPAAKKDGGKKVDAASVAKTAATGKSPAKSPAKSSAKEKAGGVEGKKGKGGVKAPPVVAPKTGKGGKRK
ncbi:hypothetical protein HDV00_002041 [Rhizophlyctis rosea]|nr:hypothetical protein HDV00_002041 [Rhizophlyctis rosea]